MAASICEERKAVEVVMFSARGYDVESFEAALQK
jgi:hypothetical protein